MHKFYFYVCPILFSLSLAANSSIEGKIIDSTTGEPLIGANIILLDTNLGGASDMDGFYNISNISIGTYTLTAMFIGYENLKKEIRIEGNQIYTIDIILEPSSIKLQETRVTAEKRRDKITSAPASIEIITSRDIKRESTTNIGSYLKGLKGVDFTSSGINNYSISIRGFNSSFNTRVLTLTDGRVANIPALRVINYSAVPQSMDDIDRMEVVLGPATALYGANAHSGVINIISKSPAHSEGLNMSVSGSHDDRQLRKINGRWAKKISNILSIKLSGMYLHGYEWPYISEEEYKAHSYPWTGNPYRAKDGKDNDGDGEPIDNDLDGDGISGEDWWNGYDDDGDGLIDEDFFSINGIDDNNNQSIDENIDLVSDIWNDGYDNDGNGTIDDDEESIDWGNNMENKHIIIYSGRSDSLINNKPNPWYVSQAIYNSPQTRPHLMGDMKYDEELMKYIFDIYIYDYGFDHEKGYPFIDQSGDNFFQKGEGEPREFLNTWIWDDFGLDGIDGTNDSGENDGIWQPGDCWIDSNENGFVDDISFNGSPDSYNTNCNENNYSDQYPYANGVWNDGEYLYNDNNNNNVWDEEEERFFEGLAMDGYMGEPFEDGNDNGKFDSGESYFDFNEDGKYTYPTGEFDGIFDTGDKNFNYHGDFFYDYGLDGIANNNDLGENDGIRQPYELYNDDNNDGIYTPPDYQDNFQIVKDTNGDGMNDYPDFEVENRKVEFRLDFDPNNNFNLTFQSGYAWTKTQQVTGTTRYLANGFEYQYFQLRGRFYNWYSQIYMNQSYSGKTHSYNLGNIIQDKSKNYAFQLQKNNNIHSFNTELVYGIDYFKTLPFTNGTILNDGPNGYDNDGDNKRLAYDGIDQDGDGMIDEKNGWCDNGITSHFHNGRIWECAEGIDEPDEFNNPESNEYGFYYQTKTELFGTSRFELITAARWDFHDLLDEGVQFAPKLGFMYKLDEKSSFRLTYGKAFNTPNSITLYTDLFVRNFGIFDVYLRGNKNGTPYCHAGDPCSQIDENFTGNIPGFWDTVADTLVPMNSSLPDDYFSGNENLSPYNHRIMGAPYFYNVGDVGPKDMLPLDTSRYLIYIPELNGEGVLYSPLESINIPDVSPIKTEKIHTLELGYKGFLGKRTHITLDYYLSYYRDFFSPPTFITPSVVLRAFDDDGNDITKQQDLQLVGLLPINSFESNPPYGTAWDGKDNDGDWTIWSGNNNPAYTCLSQECGFNWNDDKNQDGNNADPGEWGFVYWHTSTNDITDTLGYYIYQPDELFDENLTFTSTVSETYNGEEIQIDFAFSEAVGVDEYHPNIGHNEAEIISTGLIGENGEQLQGPGVATSPPHLVLSPMNYGSVSMQGMDLSFTQFFPEYNMTIDGNISWYGTTEFYNELTKKNDPINAPEWKWNGSLKWDSSIGKIAINYRHVNKFKWRDGIWAGDIGPYDIFDLHYNYSITHKTEISVSALNLLNDSHKELIGGAKMGRQIIMRITSSL